MKPPSRFIPFAMGVLAFAGVLAITSGHGPGLDPDSMAYVGAATSLSHGDGLRVPLGKWERSDSTVELTLWPPAFSAAMALPQAAGVSSLTSARIVIALAAFVTAFLIGALLVETIPVAGTVTALGIILVTPSFARVHMSVLSEPLFIAALAITLFAMVRRSPPIAAAGAALAVMTRYAGASAAIAGAIWFLFFESGPVRRRMMRAAISSAPAAISFVLWSIHNSRVKNVQGAITLRYYPGIGSTLAEAARTMLAWIAPGANAMLAAIVAIALAIGIFVAKRSGKTRAEESSLLPAATLLLVSYLAILVVSRLFVGGAIQFDARILAPAILLLEVALIPIFATILRTSGRPWQIAAAIAAVVWMCAAAAAEAPVVIDSIRDGNDFAASDWRESEMLRWIAENAPGQPIYTNWPAAAYFDAQRSAYDIPTSANPDTLELFGKILSNRKGLFAAFNYRNFDYPASDSIACGAGLVKIDSLDDGVIWGPPRQQNEAAALRK